MNYYYLKEFICVFAEWLKYFIMYGVASIIIGSVIILFILLIYPELIKKFIMYIEKNN